MREGGFGHHRIWGKLTQYLDKLDLDEVKQRAGLTEKPPARERE